MLSAAKHLRSRYAHWPAHQMLRCAQHDTTQTFLRVPTIYLYQHRNYTLQRDIPMLLRRIRIPLVFEHFQAVNQLDAGVAGFDHLVDVAACGGDVGIVELLGVFGDQFFAPLVGVGRAFDLVFEEDVDRALSTHDGDFGGGPGVVEVAAHVFAVHDVVSAAVGFARNHRDLGNGGFAIGIEQLRAMPDDAAVFLAHSRKEARHIDEGDDGNVEAVAEAHETRRFIRGIDVQHAS